MALAPRHRSGGIGCSPQTALREILPTAVDILTRSFDHLGCERPSLFAVNLAAPAMLVKLRVERLPAGTDAGVASGPRFFLLDLLSRRRSDISDYAL